MSTKNINLKENTEELVLREGAAAVILADQGIKVYGDIGNPAEFVAKRKDEITPNKCHVVFDLNNKTIEIVDKEHLHNDMRYVVRGEMKLASEIDLFLNRKWTSAGALGKYLRKNKRFFPNTSKVEDLIDKLTKFSISVTRNLKQIEEQVGTYEKAVKNTVKHDFQLKHEIKIPLHKGFGPHSLELELWIETEGKSVEFYFECYLIDELIETEVKEEFKRQEESFTDYAVFRK